MKLYKSRDFEKCDLAFLPQSPRALFLLGKSYICIILFTMSLSLMSFFPCIFDWTFHISYSHCNDRGGDSSSVNLLRRMQYLSLTNSITAHFCNERTVCSTITNHFTHSFSICTHSLHVLFLFLRPQSCFYISWFLHTCDMSNQFHYKCKKVRHYQYANWTYANYKLCHIITAQCIVKVLEDHKAASHNMRHSILVGSGRS